MDDNTKKYKCKSPENSNASKRRMPELKLNTKPCIAKDQPVIVADIVRSCLEDKKKGITSQSRHLTNKNTIKLNNTIAKMAPIVSELKILHQLFQNESDSFMCKKYRSMSTDSGIELTENDRESYYEVDNLDKQLLTLASDNINNLEDESRSQKDAMCSNVFEEFSLIGSEINRIKRLLQSLEHYSNKVDEIINKNKFFISELTTELYEKRKIEQRLTFELLKKKETCAPRVLSKKRPFYEKISLV